MLLRIILLAVIVWVVYSLIKKYAKSIDGGVAKSQGQVGEDMVRCAQCGVHIPKSEGLFVEGKVFCSEAHHQLNNN